MSDQQPNEATHAHTNRLVGESSPYLLQHAHNPVDWYPWGKDALERAKAEDKPILLSIGYSACHWCHVMAHESFENETIAGIMNRHFVSIKVDREERPDIDALYMEATIRMTGGGGWPMTVFLTPDGAPFFAGTYFPPVDRYGAPGFPRLLEAINTWYHDRRADVEEQAQAMRDIYKSSAELTLAVPPELADGHAPIESAILARAANADLATFDPDHGGTRGAPKFPHALGLEFLLRMERRRQLTSDPLKTGMAELSDELLTLVTLTLDKMADGGIHDQIGGGFHRYSTDAVWLTPHFEKMLYDNALLALVYLRAWQVTGKPRYRSVCEDTLDYVLREMSDPSGAFYSAQDADSEGEEGRYYTWTAAEASAALGDHDAALAKLVWDITERGNFEGRNILHFAHTLESAASTLGVAPGVARSSLERARRQLFDARTARVHPGLDDKAITAWNALALRALAEAGQALGREDYSDAARRSADFLTTVMLRDGRLLRTWRAGVAKLDAYLEDYGGLANGLVSVYELTGDTRYISSAQSLADALIERFWDDSVGGFFDTGVDHERLVGRPRELTDNVTPSGTSLACEALLRLAALTGQPMYREKAAHTIYSLLPLAQRSPSSFGRILCALDDLIGPFYEVAIIGRPDDANTRALRAVLNDLWYPRTVIGVGSPGDGAASTVVPLLADRPMLGDRPAAYVCQGFVCQRPVTDPEALAQSLRG
ncbi:MAG TPA: thioredoxin domain-containing protein [Ktedonobacterales bacterium]